MHAIVYLDPAAPNAPQAWSALGLLLADENGRLSISVLLAAPPQGDGSHRDRPRVRALARLAAVEGRWASFLRLSAATGVPSLEARLKVPDRRAELLRDLGLRAPGTWPDLDACPLGLPPAPPLMVPGRPLVRLDRQTFLDDATFEALRTYLDRREQERAGALRENPLTLTVARVEPAEPTLARPVASRGVLLGGPGLAHHVALLARDETDTVLRAALPELLAARRAHPGRLSIQVLARPGAPPSSDLAPRLCAARALGRELEYLRYLAREHPPRELLHRGEADLLRALDGYERPCPEEGPLPAGSGPWLDGAPVRPNALAALLEPLLRAPSPTARTRRSLLGPLLRAAPPPSP